MTAALRPPAARRGPPDKVFGRGQAVARRAEVDEASRTRFHATSPALAADLVATTAVSGVVALYAAVGDEAPTLPIAERLAAAGVRLALPVIGRRDAPLSFRAWAPGAALAPGPFGIPQPAAGAAVEPDLIFVPLLAFDVAGRRLGYGGGYYDRTLAALRAQKSVVAVGLAFAAQLVDRVPSEPHDAPLDAVLTERGLAVDRRGG